MKISKSIYPLIFLSLLTIFAACSKDDDDSSASNNNNNGGHSQGYDVEAKLEFSSGETLDFKANSVLPSFPEPFIKEDSSPHRIITAAYQTTINNLIYRFDIKAMLKEEPGQYDMYKKSENDLETLGVYYEFTIEGKKESGENIDDLYRTQYISNESGELKITTITQDRLKGTFSAVLPYMPIEKGKNLTITNGKIDIAIQWMKE